MINHTHICTGFSLCWRKRASWPWSCKWRWRNKCCHIAFCQSHSVCRHSDSTQGSADLLRYSLTQALPSCMINGNDKGCNFSILTNQKIIRQLLIWTAGWSSSETLRIRRVTQTAVRRSNRTCSLWIHVLYILPIITFSNKKKKMKMTLSGSSFSYFPYFILL